MSSGAEASEPLKCQTWVLKVSIHCEGCKKKVKKVLQGIDGVYRIMVDAQLQKVTVTGNVDANLLMKRISKAGKHAELWPEKNPDSQSPTLASATVGKKNTKKGDGNAVSPFGNPENTSDEEDTSVSDQPATIACELPKKPNETGTAAPSPPQEKLAGVEADKPSPAVAAKKKVKNSPTNPISASGSEEKTTDINGKQGLPLIQLPSTAYSSQLPAYILSYNTAQPACSYGYASLYPSTMQQSGYLYSGHDPLASTCYIPAMALPSGSYDSVSEENACACHVM
ncbi:hypothetical protein HPP92_017638 [Vanilla planifolia]|uniref:HMA domain-containing protein n=1 Tax=Vanilla planifolia TaxID=51239 RepID=A0A835UPU3_VANPL|nr:hypothetical protein HPP92_017638 [Vanilla planifolia]